ncbi:MAG: hypothetical protein KAV83_04975 [Desulfobacterales bacterium]|nr:hypothetical protein [Desulfobacterales bacterium]
MASIEHYLQALNERSDNGALIHNNLADSYMNAGQLDLAVEQAKDAISKAQDKTLPYVTLGEIHQAMGEHEKAVECVHRAQEIFEELMPEMKDALFDTIEEVIKKLPTREKFELASKDWVRMIYLVKYTEATYQMERGLIERHGGTWKGLLKAKKLALNSIGQKYLSSKERLGIKGNDAAAIAKTYGVMAAIIGSPKVKVLEKSATQSTIRVSACWQYSVIRSMGLDQDPGWVNCSFYCTEYINNVARAINQTARFEFESSLPDGNKYCEGIFRIG